jgi:hypothetical protein
MLCSSNYGHCQSGCACIASSMFTSIAGSRCSCSLLLRSHSRTAATAAAAAAAAVIAASQLLLL